MFGRPIRALALAVALLAALAPTAMAGGWAVTTLDAVPAGVRAAQSLSIGFTIRQHGVTPVRAEAYGGQVAIRIRADMAGPPVTFPARADGAVGHYLAEVRFPSAGLWTWEVEQGPFAPQPLGTVTVEGPVAMPAATPAVAPAPAARAAGVDAVASRGWGASGTALPYAAVFGLGVAGLALVALARRPGHVA